MITTCRYSANACMSVREREVKQNKHFTLLILTPNSNGWGVPAPPGHVLPFTSVLTLSTWRWAGPPGEGSAAQDRRPPGADGESGLSPPVCVPAWGIRGWELRTTPSCGSANLLEHRTDAGLSHSPARRCMTQGCSSGTAGAGEAPGQVWGRVPPGATRPTSPAVTNLVAQRVLSFLEAS